MESWLLVRRVTTVRGVGRVLRICSALQEFSFESCSPTMRLKVIGSGDQSGHAAIGGCGQRPGDNFVIYIGVVAIAVKMRP